MEEANVCGEMGLVSVREAMDRCSSGISRHAGGGEGLAGGGGKVTEGREGGGHARSGDI
jgi:hypothetical protein